MSVIAAELQAAREGPCPPICDSCRFYNFNGDEDGAYTGAGRCEHPRHPRHSEPYDACGDFDCALHPKVLYAPEAEEEVG